MCIVCIEMAKGVLNSAEAKRALKELSLDPNQLAHTELVRQEIEEKEREDSKKGKQP